MRAHPDEAFIRRKVVVRMGEVARELAAGAPNVFVIGGDEDVSSYALMPGLAGGLVWISSIGADMVARGIPVLAAARPKYHGTRHRRGAPHRPRVLERARAPGRHGRRCPATSSARGARRYLDLVFSQFSFDAFSPSYRAEDLFLEGPGARRTPMSSTASSPATFPRRRPPQREARQVA